MTRSKEETRRVRDLDEEFEFYLHFVKSLVLYMHNIKERASVSKWIVKLKHCSSQPYDRVMYIKLLLFCLQKHHLYSMFADGPPDVDYLPPFPDGLTLKDMMRRVIAELHKCHDTGAGDLQLTVETSSDLREYVAVQKIPKYGVHLYMALSDDPLPFWNKFKSAAIPNYVIDKCGERLRTECVSTSAIDAKKKCPPERHRPVYERAKVKRSVGVQAKPWELLQPYGVPPSYFAPPYPGKQEVDYPHPEKQEVDYPPTEIHTRPPPPLPDHKRLKRRCSEKVRRERTHEYEDQDPGSAGPRRAVAEGQKERKRQSYGHRGSDRSYSSSDGMSAGDSPKEGTYTPYTEPPPQRHYVEPPHKHHHDRDHQKKGDRQKERDKHRNRPHRQRPEKRRSPTKSSSSTNKKRDSERHHKHGHERQKSPSKSSSNTNIPEKDHHRTSRSRSESSNVGNSSTYHVYRVEVTRNTSGEESSSSSVERREKNTITKPRRRGTFASSGYATGTPNSGDASTSSKINRAITTIPKRAIITEPSRTTSTVPRRGQQNENIQSSKGYNLLQSKTHGSTDSIIPYTTTLVYFSEIQRQSASTSLGGGTEDRPSREGSPRKNTDQDDTLPVNGQLVQRRSSMRLSNEPTEAQNEDASPTSGRQVEETPISSRSISNVNSPTRSNWNDSSERKDPPPSTEPHRETSLTQEITLPDENHKSSETHTGSTLSPRRPSEKISNQSKRKRAVSDAGRRDERHRSSTTHSSKQANAPADRRKSSQVSGRPVVGKDDKKRERTASSRERTDVRKKDKNVHSERKEKIHSSSNRQRQKKVMIEEPRRREYRRVRPEPEELHRTEELHRNEKLHRTEELYRNENNEKYFALKRKQIVSLKPSYRHLHHGTTPYSDLMPKEEEYIRDRRYRRKYYTVGYPPQCFCYPETIFKDHSKDKYPSKECGCLATTPCFPKDSIQNYYLVTEEQYPRPIDQSYLNIEYDEMRYRKPVSRYDLMRPRDYKYYRFIPKETISSPNFVLSEHRPIKYYGKECGPYQWDYETHWKPSPRPRPPPPTPPPPPPPRDVHREVTEPRPSKTPYSPPQGPRLIRKVNKPVIRNVQQPHSGWFFRRPLVETPFPRRRFASNQEDIAYDFIATADSSSSRSSSVCCRYRSSDNKRSRRRERHDSARSASPGGRRELPRSDSPLYLEPVSGEVESKSSRRQSPSTRKRKSRSSKTPKHPEPSTSSRTREAESRRSPRRENHQSSSHRNREHSRGSSPNEQRSSRHSRGSSRTRNNSQPRHVNRN